jgi:hypothetical protein
VRITVHNRLYDYQPGEKETVLNEVADLRGECYFVVAMDKDHPSKPGVFVEDEIELDVGP